MKKLPDVPTLPKRIRAERKARKMDEEEVRSEMIGYLKELHDSVSLILRETLYRLNRVLPKDGSEPMEDPLVLMTFTIATRPAASTWTGGTIFVSDGAVGSKFQGSDGTSWVGLG